MEERLDNASVGILQALAEHYAGVVPSVSELVVQFDLTPEDGVQ